MKIRLTNKMKQVLNIMLTDSKGKLRQWSIPAKKSREIREEEMSQDVTDKETRGYLVVESLEE